MNARLTHVPLAVSDQDPALEHYTRKVGFEKRAGYKHPAGADGSPSRRRAATSSSRCRRQQAGARRA
jgi:hypothetical protein